ncbi:BTAD domain-containing putative transcriptional regulator [Streptomyces sp. NPDC057837]|uniref:AfsR/SARP family transcriptional regulator n=1 Tax=Streptomyces sp. NPDC057837 TaxID=3346260 RepID=UPI0036D07ECB
MEAQAGPDLSFSLLGPFRAERRGQPVALGSPQQRAVLTALVLNRGRSVTMSDLVDALWERPPASPAAVLRTYIWRLRQALEPGHDRSLPWQVLRSAHGGYLLEADDDAVDWLVFRRHVSQARALRAAGDPVSAVPVFDAALAMWQDRPLAGVPGPLAEREREVLRAQHLDALEARLHALTEAERFAEAAAEAAVLVARHPLRESLHELLMRSLHRTGRRADALAAYRRAHRLLGEELGVRPGPGLRALHEDVLKGGPGVASGSAPGPSRAVTGDAGGGTVVSGVTQWQRPVPRQLPHAVADFTGRAAETERIRDALLGQRAEAMPIVLVTGMGGTGKTALVLHSLQPLSATYPDGQLYADLRGADGTPTPPGAVLSAFLRALGETDGSLPDDLTERAALFRSVLAQRRVLIVLDDAADLGQITPLLPGSPTCAVVVTSRSGLATLPVSLRVVLDPLPRQEALRLFTRLVGSPRVAAEPRSAEQVVAACGGLPHALRIAGARLATRPQWSIAHLARRLDEERLRLGELRVDAVTVEAGFALGYSRLDGTAQRAFRWMALPDRSGFDVETAAAVLAEPHDLTLHALEQLVNAGLLESPAWNRYRYHDLVALFARRLTDSAEAHTVLGRLLDLHLTVAAQAYHVLRPGHTVPGTALPALAGAPRITGHEDVPLWSSTALPDILRLLAQTARTHTDRAAALLLMLDAVLEHTHCWEDAVRPAAAVARAAAADGDPLAEARARYLLGGALVRLGRLDEAREHVRHALALAERLGEHDLYAMALDVQGVITGHSDPADAARQHRRAADLARAHGNPSLEALALGNLVLAHLRREDADQRETVEASLRQLELHRRNGDVQGAAAGFHRHGQVLLRQGRPQDAITAYHRTLELLPEGELDVVRAGAHLRLAEAHLCLGQHEPASEHAETGLALSRRARHEQLEGLCLRAVGDVLAATGRRERARLLWQRALDQLSRIGSGTEAERTRARLSEASA